MLRKPTAPFRQLLASQASSCYGPIMNPRLALLHSMLTAKQLAELSKVQAALAIDPECLEKHRDAMQEKKHGNEELVHGVSSQQVGDAQDAHDGCK